MSFCKYCKVNTEYDKPNCPLCGRCCNDELKKSELKTQKEVLVLSRGRYPVYKTSVNKGQYATASILKVLILGLVFAVALELMFNHNMAMSLYGVVGVAFVTLNILLPIYKKNTIWQLCTRTAVYLPALLLFVELYTHSFGWGVHYVIPFVWLGVAAISGILTISSGFVKFEMIRPLFMVAMLSTASLIFTLIYNWKAWPTLTAAFVAWGTIALLFMFRFKRTIKNLKKDLRL